MQTFDNEFVNFIMGIRVYNSNQMLTFENVISLIINKLFEYKLLKNDKKC